MEQPFNYSQLPEGAVLHKGRYEIRRFLGQGGFGITYEAWDRTLQITVAIKEFFPRGQVYRDVQQSWELRCLDIADAENSFEKGKKRFIHEAQVLAGLNSSHIVRVYDSFGDNGTVYIVMEYLSGSTLADFVKQNGPMDSQTLLAQFIPLMEGLHLIHNSELLHRDLSPDNIMFTKEKTLKIIDFGTARDLAPEGDKSVSTSIVHLHYSPVEMFASGKKDCQADIYSLCATMYYCLTGREPEISVERIFSDSLVPLSRITTVPKNLERVILWGMAVKPENRYASVAEMQAELQKSRLPNLARIIGAAVVAAGIVTVGIGWAVTKQPEQPSEPTVSVEQPTPEREEPEAVEPEPAEPYVLAEGICWENPAGIENPGENQTEQLECAAIQAKYSMYSSYSEADINLEYVKQEFKRRLDLLNVEYAFGWAQEDETVLYVQLPQKETPYEVLPMLLGDQYSAKINGVFWEVSWGTNLSWGEDGSVTVSYDLSYAQEDLEENLQALKDGEVSSLTAYLCVEDCRIYRTELTEYPEDGAVTFRELLLEKEDGEWDASGFLALMKDVTALEDNPGLEKYRVEDATFPNLNGAYYTVKSDMKTKKVMVNALRAEYPEMEAYEILDDPNEVALMFHFPVDDTLVQSFLTAAEKVYTLIEDGSVEKVICYFADEEETERCRVLFYPSQSVRKMQGSLSCYGGRFDQYAEELWLRLDSESWPWDKDVTYTIETAGDYQIVQERTYQFVCPVPADYVVDKDAYGSDLLVKLYSPETTNYVEFYGKTLDEATTAQQAMQEDQASIDGTVELATGGETWYVLSIRQSDGSYLYRKCRVAQGGTVLIWFDFHISQSNDQVAEQLDYMEDQFATDLPG